MNSPKVVVTLGLILIFSVLFTGCGGGGTNTTTPPPGTPIIQTASLPQGAVNAAYGFGGNGTQLSATGGKSPYTWSIVTGSLPPGLTLNSTTAVISGTPTTLGNDTFTVQVTDSLSMSYQKQFSIYVEGVVSITPMLLPSGTPNVPYTNADGSAVQLMATGGLKPYTWCVLESSGTCDDGTGGALPAGLSLSTSGNAGVISGVPTTDGAPTMFTVQVMDAETSPGVPAIGSSSLTITIMSITTTSLPPGYLNTAYGGSLTVAGGSSPYTWSVVSGTLPPGLSLDFTTCINTKSLTCKITGTPTQVGAYPITFSVIDGEKSNPAVAMVSVTIDVFQSQLVITTTSLPAGIVSIAYSTTLQATGGTPPYTWCIFETDGTCDNGAGILPSGLTFNTSTGVISGTPTMAGTSSFTVQAADSESPQQKVTSGTLTIVINPPLTNGNLKGNYAFTFSGYKNGSLVIMAGAFVANGDGTFQAGFLDLNDGTGEANTSSCGNGSNTCPTPQMIDSTKSSYSIQANGLGTMTLVTNLATYNLSVAITTNGSGRLIQDNADPNQRGSGVIKAQVPSNLCSPPGFCVGALIKGSFAVGLFGTDATGKRYAAAGTYVQQDNQGDLGNGVQDANDNGATASLTFSGTLFSTVDPTTGRGVAANLTFQGQNSPCNGQGTHPFCIYAYYFVSQNELILISTENITATSTNLTLWSSLRQLSPVTGSISFDNTALLGTSVAELNALDTNGAVDVTAGLFAGQGVPGHTCTSGQNGGPQSDPAAFSYDENQGGKCNGGTCGQPQSSQGTYCVDKITGRVTLTGFTGQFGAFPPVFYMVATDRAFVVGTDPAVTSGILEQQTGSPFTNGSVSGPYIGGTVTPVTSGVTDAVSWLFANGTGNINGTENTSGPGPGPQNFNYTYAVDSTGRALVCTTGTCNAQNNNMVGVLYVISPQKFVMLPTTTDPNPALSIFNQ